MGPSRGFAALVVTAAGAGLACGAASAPGGGNDNDEAPAAPASVGDAAPSRMSPGGAGGGGTARDGGGGGGSGGTGGAAGSGAAAGAGGGSDGSPSSGASPLYGTAPYALRPEWTGPCRRADRVDVNLGNAAEAFVRAAHCQVRGTEADAATVQDWATKLRTLEYVRRIDVVRSFCLAAGRACTLAYSDPWNAHPPLEQACKRVGRREMGAVLMLWSHCPGGTNCKMDWANTHALGMERPDALLGFGATSTGVYSPDNPGWWARELLDARYAGLTFLLLNVFGPDIAKSPGPLEKLAQALETPAAGVRIALLDDTWTWGRAGVEPPWNAAPDLSDAERASEILYVSKWRPFFQRVPRAHWYMVRGAPFIYFYNAGTLGPRTVASAVIARMKDRFQADFGVRPFVAVDHAFFEDRNMPKVADSEFTWSTLKLPDRRSRSTRNGFILDHFMVKWDAIGRERPGAIAEPDDRMFKGPDLLEQLLQKSADADVAVIATWNDLGEGTGIERNYDYYHRGAWLTPDRFLQAIRRSQCSE